MEFGTPTYGLTRTLAQSHEIVVTRVRDALAAEGFGVLTEIDVQATLKTKLDVDLEPYVILGACNPGLAHRALTVEPAIGLLLPCNVVVAVAAGGTVVSVADPRAMFQMVHRVELEDIVADARARLERVLAAL